MLKGDAGSDEDGRLLLIFVYNFFYCALTIIIFICLYIFMFIYIEHWSQYLFVFLNFNISYFLNVLLVVIKKTEINEF